MPKLKTPENFYINYEIHGNKAAEQTIIFAHGNGNCIEDWRNLGYIDKLTTYLPHTKLIFMDALGYGDSDKPIKATEYTPERRASDVIAVLDNLNISKAVFFGASVGGSLGFVLADLYPERFSGFLIGSAHPYGYTQPIGCNIFDESFRTTIKLHGMLGFVTDLETKYLQRQFHDAVRPQYLKNDPQAIIAANTLEWPNRRESLSKIRVPVLLFAGDKDPVSQFQPEIGAQISQAEVLILPNTDHCDAYWNSEKIVPLIAEFVKRKHLAS